MTGKNFDWYLAGKESLLFFIRIRINRKEFRHQFTVTFT